MAWYYHAARAPKPDNHDFWDEAPHDRTMWRVCTFVRVGGNSTVEQLVEAAGVGRVVDDVAVSVSDVNDYTNWFVVQSSACLLRRSRKSAN